MRIIHIYTVSPCVHWALQPSSAVRGRVATCHGNRGFITKDSSPHPLSWLKQKSHFQFPNPPWQDRDKTHTHTAVLTLLCLRRHFADTWGNIKTRLSIVLVCFFFLPGVVFPSVVKKWIYPPCSPGSAWLYHSARWIYTLWLFSGAAVAFSGIKGRIQFLWVCF